MNINQIEAFLEVVSSKNISEAARKLYVSQSTVSQRIKELEEELKITLFNREQGNREVELTALGLDFLVMAEQWYSMLNEMRKFRYNLDRSTISIGSVDIVNNYGFSKLYRDILIHEPNVHLKINTHHSYEIHALLENHTIDLGFVFSKTKNRNLDTFPIYSERMYLVCNKSSNYYEGISVKDLSQSNEVYLKWGPEYSDWHDLYWDANKRPLVTVNTGNLLINYLLHVENTWTIAPLSVIESFQHYENIIYYEIEPSPPKHVCYLLMHHLPKYSHRKGIALFRIYLIEFLKTCKWIDELYLENFTEK